jgi:cell division protein FtsB
MSQSAAAARTARAPRPAARGHVRPAPATARSPHAPRLRVVSAPRHTRSRAGLVVACVGLLALGLVGLLLLDVSLERGTYDLRDQNVRAEQLRERQQRLQQEIRDKTAPQNLAAQARKLGMVDAPGAPVFVLPNGRTIGVPQRAAAPPSPTVTDKPSLRLARAPARTPAVTRHPAGKASPASKARSAATVSRSPAAAPTPTPGH